MKKTMSDAELRRRIKYNEKQLKIARPGSRTEEEIQKSLDYYRAQLALPRDQRCQYEDGSL